eukprot:CAMPEP_0117027602 /NCGR_PEP_ID=MMETSP0472-20121206/20158_1 /TAXON_ID=693140 ORGANISM="Tiarina fusus, Strain LIS" /NCGR_SAMPLE_ID=MMETSP0472 /ASSEMBLY_ACC=CAM_ASM_000603 /LENGTH=248 /DNA_ID=CAMNT_0004734887 /DNA_START=169 /DNA_END=916 /DNA_ORIENTATION=+
MSTTPEHKDSELQSARPTKAHNRMRGFSDTSVPFDVIANEVDQRESTDIRVPKPDDEINLRTEADSPMREGATGETDEERARREEEESVALAQALMAEEAMAVSYAMSVDYLRHNRDQFSEEDLAALQAAMAEEEEEVEIEADDDGDMSYELMLRLGERLGDVKSERWARVAQEKIAALPTLKFNPETARGKDDNDCDVKCLVCQFSYEKDDVLRRLPCEHCFHAECVDQWLKSKDCCPYCRTTIVKS